MHVIIRFLARRTEAPRKSATILAFTATPVAVGAAAADGLRPVGLAIYGGLMFGVVFLSVLLIERGRGG